MPKLAKTNSWITSSGFDDWNFVEEEQIASTKVTKQKAILKSKCLLPEDISRYHNDITDTNQTLSWNEKYKPEKISELAIHPKKIEDLKKWLENAKHLSKGGANICLVTGGSGVGKSTTLEVLCKHLEYEIQEWINPLTISFESLQNTGVRYQSQQAEFSEFLFRCGRYPALQFTDDNNHHETAHNKLLVIEDFPNFLLRDPLIFKDVLKQYKRTQLFPLVLVISSGGSMDALKRQLLPLDLVHELNIHTINFNLISNTLMTKAVKNIASFERKDVSKDEFNEILAVAGGDIRSAINCLQFQEEFDNSLKHCTANRASNVTGRRKRKKSSVANDNTSSSSNAFGGKDTPLVLFRALGKILYCKRNPPGENINSNYKLKDETKYRDPFVIEPESVQDQCCLSGRAFSLFLHQNFVDFYTDVDDLSKAYDCFCASDVIGNATSYDLSSGSASISDLYEGSIAARGVALNNSSRATAKLCETAVNKWRPLHKPSWYQVYQKQKENEIYARSIFWLMNLRSQELILTLLPYLSKITMKSRQSVNLNHSQRQFLNNVVNLPQWKSFVRSDGLNETEVAVNEDSHDDEDVVVATEEAVKPDQEEDEYEIVEISD